MAAGIAFPVNWMLEPRHVLHLIKEANAKAVIALGPTPGFKIWESLMSIAGDLALGTSIWSVAGPDGDVLPDTDLDTHIGSLTSEQDANAMFPNVSVSGTWLKAHRRSELQRALDRQIPTCLP